MGMGSRIQRGICKMGWMGSNWVSIRKLDHLQSMEPNLLAESELEMAEIFVPILRIEV
jgi:hypothetical protein